MHNPATVLKKLGIRLALLSRYLWKIVLELICLPTGFLRHVCGDGQEGGRHGCQNQEENKEKGETGEHEKGNGHCR